MQNLTDEEKYFAAHITDLAAQCRKQGVPRFSNFLTPREQATACGVLIGEDYFVFGGADDTERNIVGVFTESYAAFDDDKSGYFPIRAITFCFRSRDVLTHRDFLGCILSLGIKRELVGDIFVAEGFAVVFTVDAAYEMIKSIEKVGNVGVTAEDGITHGLPERKFEQLDGVVSSMRLDCIVAMLTNMSREKTSQLIKSGLVQLDGADCCEVSRSVEKHGILSVRGFGKFRLSEIGAETKKGRYHITVQKYT